MSRNPKKLLNDPNNVPVEQLEGLLYACGGKLIKVDNYSGVYRHDITNDQVIVVTGGGSGHEPMFAGYVGKGLADAAALGEIFASPSPDIIIETTKAAQKGKGVLFVYGNYAGDNMNFDIATELLEEEGIQVKTVRVTDDISAAPLSKMSDRRGVAGDMYVLKIAGAAVAQGYDLEKLHEVTSKANFNTRTMGVALGACSIPQTGKFNFELADDELELGMGIHGEPGVRRQKMTSADEINGEIVARLCEDIELKSGDRVCVTINNLGASTYTELLIANRKVHQELTARGIEIYDTLIGNYCTSQEMAGFSVTIFCLDDELQKLYDMPCDSFAWRK
ncbi:dihydroxyacetone kinase subunit DhaK [Testudinibacter aquarius]|uniref:Dihydroxyacetone kinase DhaK subunit n=1 Tax=Testudinibacter aquarius TaxID=1524974 RepID=A0A4V2W2Z1_9PAST|nr:dihydroxyacetone kinase subunit DhaK [Testudinibacter aquarius]KAE9529366.1 dihydroxyacetone kinase [Testudinibacter aquarius]TCV89889.1 dihydroxyacetone kinase DhaK subunit [Testudinibacter aquarius]TNG93738.1 dihydroxyacetone kinase subunit DhaK [Testudinibacter aquarius]